jgi:chromosome segregation ATPase
MQRNLKISDGTQLDQINLEMNESFFIESTSGSPSAQPHSGARSKIETLESSIMKQLSDYENRISQLTQTVTDLRGRNFQLRQIEELAWEKDLTLERCKAREHENQAIVEAQYRQLQEFQSGLAEAHFRIEDLLQEQAQLKTLNLELHKDTDSKHRDLSAKDISLATAHNSIGKLQSELDELNAIYSAELTQLRQTLALKNKEISNFVELKSLLNQRLEEFTQQNASLSDVLVSKNIKIQEQATVISQLNTSITSLRSEAQQFETNLITETFRIEELHKQTLHALGTESHQKTHQLREQIKSLQSQLDLKQSVIRDNESLNTVHQHTIRQQQEEYQLLKYTTEEQTLGFQTLIANKTAQIDTAEKTISEQGRNLVQLHNLVNQAKFESEVSRRNFEQQLQLAHSAQAQSQDAIKTLYNKLSATEQNLARLTLENERKEEIINKLSAEIQNREQNVQNISNEIKVRNLTIQQLSGDVEGKDKVIRSQSSEIESKNLAIQRLSNGNDNKEHVIRKLSDELENKEKIVRKLAADNESKKEEIRRLSIEKSDKEQTIRRLTIERNEQARRNDNSFELMEKDKLNKKLYLEVMEKDQLNKKLQETLRNIHKGLRSIK